MKIELGELKDSSLEGRFTIKRAKRLIIHTKEDSRSAGIYCVSQSRTLSEIFGLESCSWYFSNRHPNIDSLWGNKHIYPSMVQT